MYFSSYKYSIFFIRAVVADNHSANVNAFNILLDKLEEDKKEDITIPKSQKEYFYFLTRYIYLKCSKRSLYFLVLHLKYQIFIFLPRMDIQLGLTYTKYIWCIQ